MRMVRGPKAGSASDPLSLWEPVGNAAGVDDLDLRIIPAGGFRECQAFRGVPRLHVYDQNADARVCAKEIETFLNTGRHQDIVAIAQKAIPGQDAGESIPGNQKNKRLSSHTVPLRGA